MKFEQRLEARIVVPIIMFLLAQTMAALAWGYSIGSRVSALESLAAERSAQLERIENKIDSINHDLIEFAKGMQR